MRATFADSKAHKVLNKKLAKIVPINFCKQLRCGYRKGHRVRGGRPLDFVKQCWVVGDLIKCTCVNDQGQW